jgi:hypothetical protein
MLDDAAVMPALSTIDDADADGFLLLLLAVVAAVPPPLTLLLLSLRSSLMVAGSPWALGTGSR